MLLIGHLQTFHISMKEVLPEFNQRIKSIVDHFAKGNVSKFVRYLQDQGQDISQQKFNRLFNIDTRTQKYPGVSTDVVTAITEVFPEIDNTWLLTGEGDMLKRQVSVAGDKMNSVKAFMLAIADDYANRIGDLTQEDPEKIKKEIVKKANLILGGLNQWPFEDQ